MERVMRDLVAEEEEAERVKWRESEGVTVREDIRRRREVGVGLEGVGRGLLRGGFWGKRRFAARR